jgi:YHS domain-containing protein
MKKIFPILGLAIVLSAALITLAVTKEAVKDPVCGMEVDATTASFKVDSPHGAIYFCSQSCMDKFQANPAAYIKAEKNEKAMEKAAAKGCTGCDDHKAKEAAQAEKAAAKTGCEGCAHKTTEAKTAAAEKAALPKIESCTGLCGQTKVTEINHFHELMPIMETGEVAKIKATAAEMMVRKEAVMKAKCPDGICPNGFGAARTAFGQKVEALAEVVKTGDDVAILNAFNAMHTAYEALDVLAR